MAEKEALEFLQEEIDNRIIGARKKRKRDRSRAITLKMSSTIFAGIITILVGLQGEAFNQKTLRNIALTLGATITVINAYDAFFDHRSLWIRRTVTLTRLYSLRRELKFEVAKAALNNINNELLSHFTKSLSAILQEDIEQSGLF